MSDASKFAIHRVGRNELDKLRELLRRDAADSHRKDPAALQKCVDGLDRSLAKFDFLASGSHWLLVAERAGVLVGYLSAARIQKADARIGVLYIDELFVLEAHRRHCAATQLWNAAKELARDLGLWRIRLIVEQEKSAPREFYKQMGWPNALLSCARSTWYNHNES